MKLYYFPIPPFKRILQIALAILLSFILILSVLSREEVVSTVTAPSVKPISKIDTDQKIVALALDLNWGNEILYETIDILKAHNIKATFFLAGSFVLDYPKEAEIIVKNGHEIASHSQNHIDLTAKDEAFIKAEINTAHQAILEATGVDTYYLKLPNNAWNENVISIANGLGYQVIEGSKFINTWKTKSSEDIALKITDNIEKGDIISLDINNTSSQNPQILKLIIKNLTKEGYSFLTVGQLLEGKTTSSE